MFTECSLSSWTTNLDEYEDDNNYVDDGGDYKFGYGDNEGDDGDLYDCGYGDDKADDGDLYDRGLW